MQSSQPRKQRKFRFTAPMHARQKFANAHISKELKKKLNLSRRAIGIRSGDTVKVMAGSNFGKEGKVNKVDLSNGKILIEGIARKNAKGKEKMLPISISNVYITDLNLSDKLRKEKLGVS